MKHLSLLLAASLAAAHMEMNWPPPFRSKFNHNSNPSTIDYTMTAPLLADGTNFPCKNYHIADLGTPSGRPTASFAAGQNANLTITGGAIHGGGSCQVSLSYDRGHTFTVVQSIEGGCPASPGQTAIEFAIPFDAPQGEALLAWTWFNNLGNREMYMNCAAVTIKGNVPRSLSDRATHTPLNARPKLFTANIGNMCNTVDSTDLQFPQPGPDVDIKSSRGVVAPRGNGCQAGNGAIQAAPPDDAYPKGPSLNSLGTPPQPVAAVIVSSKSSSSPSSTSPSSSQYSATPSAAASPSASSSSNGEQATPVASLVAASPSPESTNSSSASEPSQTVVLLESTSSSSEIAPGTKCSQEGRWSCLHNGASFQRCAAGQWSAVQVMAKGTVCRISQSEFDIVASRRARRWRA